MMALHRIAEQSPVREQAGEPLSPSSAHCRARSPMRAPVSGASVSVEEMLREANQKVRQVQRQVDFVGGAYRDVCEQLRPLQEAYERKLHDCRFLEVQCRRLDILCRRFEEQAGASTLGGGQRPSLWELGRAEPPRGSPRPEHMLSISVQTPPFSGNMPCSSPSTGSSSARRVPISTRHARRAEASASPRQGPSSLTPKSPLGRRPWTWSAEALQQAGASAYSPRLAPSTRAGQSPRGLAHASSVNGLRLEGAQRRASSPTTCAEDYIRRVVSDPQLPSTQRVLHEASGGVDTPTSTNIHSAGTTMTSTRNSAASARTPTNGDDPPSARDTSFNSSTFLSLAKQQGDKSAALRYLISSTSSALSSFSEPQTSTAGGGALPSRNTIGGTPARPLAQSDSRELLSGRQTSMQNLRGATHHPPHYATPRHLSKSSSAQSMSAHTLEGIVGYTGAQSPRDAAGAYGTRQAGGAPSPGGSQSAASLRVMSGSSSTSTLGYPPHASQAHTTRRKST